MSRPPISVEESARRLRHRNLAMALALGALVVLFFAITLIKGVPLLKRPL